MSEPNAGSDLGAMQTKAVKSGNEYILSGSKLSCTAAQVAEIFVVFARLSDEPGLKEIGALLVPRDAPGLIIGKHIELIGLHGTGMAELVFDGCRVPSDNLLLPPGKFRKLFRFSTPTASPPIRGSASASLKQPLKQRSSTARSVSSSAKFWLSSKACSGASRTWRSISRLDGPCSIGRLAAANPARQRQSTLRSPRCSSTRWRAA